MSQHKPTSASSYVQIGILLTVITLVEIWLPSWSAQITYNVFLLGLATLKFWLVVQIFMHMRQDGKVVGGIFALGLLLAGGTIWALLALMNPNVGNPSQRSLTHADAVAISGIEDGGGEAVAPIEDTEASAEEIEALVAQGALVAVKMGCSVCHSTDGVKGVGPSWLGLFGSEETMGDGAVVVVDEAYIRESIQEPAAKVVETYFVGMMPTTPLTDEELTALVAYIMSL